ncbi:hypothetical protein NA57DRAFT_59518 [Rhizodiscina lignyota]|uniref:Uncharacterized protein n=1 Tax=Rhizodiscina lignyota TaxID=1504668 RepID=A0A9P4IA55_9PEZI|nr:hypothetical protein NA57DRAFT_59518 [Rhizodiscina lignyota]
MLRDREDCFRNAIDPLGLPRNQFHDGGSKCTVLLLMEGAAPRAFGGIFHAGGESLGETLLMWHDSRSTAASSLCLSLLDVVIVVHNPVLVGMQDTDGSRSATDAWEAWPSFAECEQHDPAGFPRRCTGAWLAPEYAVNDQHGSDMEIFTGCEAPISGAIDFPLLMTQESKQCLRGTGWASTGPKVFLAIRHRCGSSGEVCVVGSVIEVLMS